MISRLTTETTFTSSLCARSSSVDAVYADLHPDHQYAIADLIESMAEGMAWASERFVEQGGVLVDDKQLLHYCHNVIGYPAGFIIGLLTGNGAESNEDALAMSEMIQLANITRDIEKDLERGIAYDPALQPHLFGANESAVRDTRERLVGIALSRAPSFRRLYVGAGLTGRPGDPTGGGAVAAVHRSPLSIDDPTGRRLALARTGGGSSPSSSPLFLLWRPIGMRPP